MGDIVAFSGRSEQEPDLDYMDRSALLAYLNEVRAQIIELDLAEPDDMESEEHEDWGSRHEELEDLVDEIMDRLDAADD